MSQLERRYRLVLRLLPAWYRQAWAEEMVTAYLESMSTDDPDEADYLREYGRPSWPEVASVVALAARLHLTDVRTRLGVAADAPPRYAAWGSAVRLVALVGLLAHAAAATVGIGFWLWLTGHLPGVAPPGPEWTVRPATFWDQLSLVFGFVWLPAYLLLVFGFRSAARVLAAVGLSAEILSTGLGILLWNQQLSSGLLYAWLLDGLLVAALVAFHRGAPPVRRRPWLLALPVGVALASLELLLLPGAGRTVPLLEWPAMCCAAVTVAGLACLALPASRRAGTAAAWPPALALLGLGVLGLRTVSLLDYVLYAPAAERPELLAFGAVEVLVVLAVTAPLAVRASHTLRTLPTTTEVASTPIG